MQNRKLLGLRLYEGLRNFSWCHWSLILPQLVQISSYQQCVNLNSLFTTCTGNSEKSTFWLPFGQHEQPFPLWENKGALNTFICWWSMNARGIAQCEIICQRAILNYLHAPLHIEHVSLSHHKYFILPPSAGHFITMNQSDAKLWQVLDAFGLWSETVRLRTPSEIKWAKILCLLCIIIKKHALIFQEQLA